MKKFFLEIITPEKVFYSGDVEVVLCPTVEGFVSIYAFHQPMVLALQPGYVKITADGETREAFISEGFIEIRPDETILLTQAVEWPEDIDEAKALEAKLRAEELLRQKSSNLDYKKNKIALQKAFARLQVKTRNRKI